MIFIFCQQTMPSEGRMETNLVMIDVVKLGTHPGFIDMDQIYTALPSKRAGKQPGRQTKVAVKQKPCSHRRMLCFLTASAVAMIPSLIRDLTNRSRRRHHRHDLRSPTSYLLQVCTDSGFFFSFLVPCDCKTLCVNIVGFGAGGVFVCPKVRAEGEGERAVKALAADSVLLTLPYFKAGGELCGGWHVVI